MCGFCNVWLCVCVGFVMCGCVCVWVLYCVLVLVICVLVFTVFYVVGTVFFVLFLLCIYFLTCFIYNCHRVTTQLQLVVVVVIIIIIIIIIERYFEKPVYIDKKRTRKFPSCIE
jgi:hypothetical protein